MVVANIHFPFTHTTSFTLPSGRLHAQPAAHGAALPEPVDGAGVQAGVEQGGGPLPHARLPRRRQHAPAAREGLAREVGDINY